MTIAWINGQFLPIEKATVSIEDRGFQFADGVYDVIACHDGRYVALLAHIQRLRRSCAAIDIKLPHNDDWWQSLCHEAYKRADLKKAMIYLQVTRGTAKRIHAPVKNMQPTLILTVRDLPQPTEDIIINGISCITMPDFRWQRGDIKSIALLASVMGKKHATQQQAYEGFWVNKSGYVLEGCSTNILAVINDVIVTHPNDKSILPGITRALAIKEAIKQGLEVKERPWRLDEQGLTECLLTTTTSVLLPIIRMNDQDIANGKPGEIVKQLRPLMLKNMFTY
ncbi:MAG: aminotransferase class IV [Mariprofundales bacterium]